MKKILIGAGIGCGVIALVGVIAVVAGGFWAKSKLGDVEEFAAKAEETEKRVEALNGKHAFQAPPKGSPVAITEKRLQEYLAVRTALQPVWKTYEQKAKELEGDGETEPGIGDAFKAAGQLASFVNELHGTWLDQLEAKAMSPREYHAITAALYTSNWGKAVADFKKSQRPMFEEMKKSLEEQLASADESAKKLLEEQLAGVDRQLAALPAADAEPTEAEKVHAANHVLYEKYKGKIEEQAAQGLDFLLVGTGADGGSLGEAFDQIRIGHEDLGGDGEEPSEEEAAE